MSLTLISSPVTTDGGVTNNIFAGFLPVKYQFKREDLQITAVGSGINNNIQISTPIDLSSTLSVGKSVYIYAEGDSGDYTYDDSGLVTAVDAVSVTIDIDYIESASSGYINYLFNYYVEGQLVNVDNNDVKILKFSIKDDGDAAGNIYIDVSIARDQLYQVYEWITGDINEERIKFKLQYRQVYDGSSESFTLIDEEIILVYAPETPNIENFLSPFEYPTIYQGYNAGITLCHSNMNNDELGLVFTFDTLDINQNALVSGTAIKSISANEYGLIFVDFEKDTSVHADTEYIQFNAAFVVLPDYQAGDYSSDYDIT